MRDMMQIPEKMTVIGVKNPGGPDVLLPETRPVPTPNPGEVLVRVRAAGVNRPDLLQRMGKYPPPPGASDVLGLEIAGEIAFIPQGTSCPYPVGTRVCALLSGGGYAEYATAPVGQILPLPDHISDVQGAALPEGLFTIWQNVFKRGALTPHDSVLIHGGASGIGTLAIQMIRYWQKMQGNQDPPALLVTAGSAAKCAACVALGASAAIDYKTQDFVAEVDRITHGRGVDLILDMVGGDYIPRNLACLAPGGRHVTIAMLHGSAATIDLRLIMTRGLTLTGSTLRPRTIEEKCGLCRDIETYIWPGIISGQIAPVIHRTFPLLNAADAHTMLESGETIGKIILNI